MNVSYIRDMTYQYMIVGMEESCRTDFRLSMILNNHLSGFLPVHLQQTDGACALRYEITGLISFAEYLDGKRITYEEIAFLMLSFCSAVQEADQFLLSADGILLEPECIYTADEMKKFYFCYYPGVKWTVCEAMNRLCRFLIEHIDFEDRKTAQLAYALFQESLKENLSISAVRRCIELEVPEDNADRMKDRAENRSEATENEPLQENVRDAENNKKASRQVWNRLINFLLTAGIICLFLYGIMKFWRKLEAMNIVQEASMQMIAGSCIVILACIGGIVFLFNKKENTAVKGDGRKKR